MEQLSLHRLADSLCIRTASLYTHIGGLEHLRTLLAERALQKLRQALQEAVEGKDADDALHALSAAYCAFSQENREMYRLILAVPHAGKRELVEAGRAVKRVLFDVLACYTSDRTLQIQLSRQLHSLLHGFVSLDQLGFFDPATPIEDSLDAMIGSFVRQLRAVSADAGEGSN